MIRSLDEIDSIIIDRVIKDYEKSKMPINNIAGKYSLERNVVLAILGNRVRLKELPNGYIKGNTFIAIGDTHIGSKLEKMTYLDYVYDFAIKNNITDIVHAGDLIQSTIKPVQKEFVTDRAQLEHVIKNYPFDESIKNHILFGNHDFHTLNKSPRYYRILSSRKDFNLLGFKRAYLNWQKYLICIDHPIRKYRIEIPNQDPLLRIIGHSHSFHMGEPNNIYTPSLCLDQKYYSNQIPYPGFLVISRVDNETQITLYVFKDHIYDINDIKEIKLTRESIPEVTSYGVVRTFKMRDNMTIGKR